MNFPATMSKTVMFVMRLWRRWSLQPTKLKPKPHARSTHELYLTNRDKPGGIQNNFCAFMSVTTQSLARRCTAGVKFLARVNRGCLRFLDTSDTAFCFSARSLLERSNTS